MMADLMWSEFHFLRPALLWLLIPAAWLLLRWLNNTSKHDGWQQSCDPELLAAMQIQTAAKGTRWTWLYWPITFITILALAGPALRQVPVPVVKNQSALVIALDVSKSMLSDDLKPSRLQRAKFKIQDLLEKRQDGQTALVVYSGDAFVVTPLTDDTETIVSLLDVLDPSIMPVSGTNTVAALDKAADLLAQAGVNKGQVLLVTDSIDMYKTENRLEAIADAGITTHVLAVGTAEGAPIPTNQGFLKDLRGQIVIPQVDYNSLQDAAKIGQGHFSVLSNSISEDTLYEVNPNTEDTAASDDEMSNAKFIDDGPLLAILIIPMLALLYRRGILMVLCLGFMLNTQPSYAWSWDDLWLNRDQQAYQQLDTEPDAAFNKADSQQLKAAAAYKKQDFKTAAQLYDQSATLADHYNRGNALAQAGELEAALGSYNQALTFDPNDEDTLYNKKIVEEALQQQQQQQEQQQNQQNQEQNNQDQQSQESQENSEQEQNEQQQQAQNDQESEADQQQTEEQQQQQQQEQQSQQQEGEEQEQEIELTPEEKALDAEEKQAMEQWLRRIKDDPGGLMRRKFLYQYHKRNQNGESYDNQTTEDW